MGLTTVADCATIWVQARDGERKMLRIIEELKFQWKRWKIIRIWKRCDKETQDKILRMIKEE